MCYTCQYAFSSTVGRCVKIESYDHWFTDQSDPDTASAAALLSSASSALSAIEGRALSATTIGVRLGDANETDELGQIEQSFRRALIRFSFMFWVGWTAVRYYCAGRSVQCMDKSITRKMSI